MNEVNEFKYEWIQYAEDNEFTILRMLGFEDCELGILERIGTNPVLCYDAELVIQKLMRENSMPRDEAEEYFHYNQAGAGLGEYAPMLLYHRDTEWFLTRKDKPNG